MTGSSAISRSASAGDVVRGSASRFSPSFTAWIRARFASLPTMASARWLPSSVSPRSWKLTRGVLAASASK